MHDYIGALWWKYFSENAADQASEPEAGIAAIRATWEHQYPHSNAAMNLAIGRYVPGVTHEDLWVNFTVANLAKDYHGIDGVSVPRKYRYRDEEQGGAPSFGSIDNFAVKQNITPGDVILSSRSTEIQPRAAQYFVVKADVNVNTIDFEIDQSSTEFLFYTTLVVGNGEFRENRSRAKGFRTTLRNVAGKTVIFIVTGPPFVRRTTLHHRIWAG